jgi:uncharacterized membrane protein
LKKKILNKKKDMNTLHKNLFIFFAFVCLVFILSLITVTLIVVYQIYNQDINQSMVKYIEIGNWVLVSILIAISLSVVVIFPTAWKYRHIDLKNIAQLEPSKNHPASFT